MIKIKKKPKCGNCKYLKDFPHEMLLLCDCKKSQYYRCECDPRDIEVCAEYKEKEKKKWKLL